MWVYVCDVCAYVMNPNHIDAGDSNSGYKIDQPTVDRMVEKLQIEIALGNHKKYETSHTKELKSLPDEKCDYCKGSGIRTDLATKESKCNVCQGKGTNRPFSTNYPFSAKNVEEFTEFLSQSGGIQIC